MFRKSTDGKVSKCNDGCILCREYLHVGQELTLKDGSIVKPNSNFDCMSRNLLYLAECSGCQEVYLGETGDQLNNRFTVHRQQSKVGAQLQPVKADQHFRVCGNDSYKVFPFLKPKKNCTIYRRLLESSLVKKLQPVLNGISTFQPTI